MASDVNGVGARGRIRAEPIERASEAANGSINSSSCGFLHLHDDRARREGIDLHILIASVLADLNGTLEGDLDKAIALPHCMHKKGAPCEKAAVLESEAVRSSHVLYLLGCVSVPCTRISM